MRLVRAEIWPPLTIKMSSSGVAGATWALSRPTSLPIRERAGPTPGQRVRHQGQRTHDHKLLCLQIVQIHGALGQYGSTLEIATRRSNAGKGRQRSLAPRIPASS